MLKRWAIKSFNPSVPHRLTYLYGVSWRYLNLASGGRITAWRPVQTFLIPRSQPVEGRRPALQVGAKCIDLMTQLPKLNQEKDPRDSVWGVCPAAARVQFAEVTARNASHQQDLDAVVGPCWKGSQEFFCSSASTCRQFSQQSGFDRGAPGAFAVINCRWIFAEDHRKLFYNLNNTGQRIPQLICRMVVVHGKLPVWSK